MNKYNLCVLKYISFYSLTLVADIVIFRFCLFRLFFLIIVILVDLIFVFLYQENLACWLIYVQRY